MKTTILLFSLVCILFAPVASHAQKVVPLVELEKLLIRNANDFETFALSNDYSIVSKLSGDVTKVYWSDKANTSGKKNTLSRTAIPGSAIKVEFTTTDKKWYLEVKTIMGSKGYKFVSDEKKMVNGVSTEVHNFTSGRCHLALYSWSTDATWYAAELHL